MNNYELINENFQPVLLGRSVQARKIARSFLLKYGISSYICDNQKSIFSLLSISSVFIKLSSPHNTDLLCDQLLRLAASDSSCIWLAIPCTEEYKRLIEEKRQLLESVYIIPSTDKISLSHPLLYDLRIYEKDDKKLISGGKINVS